MKIIAGGTEGNERLTVQTGAVLFLGLAVLGITIVRIGQLTWLHMFLGLLLIGPVLLKLSSTGYRFARYYTHNPAYLRKGPPPAALRVLGPLVVLSTLAVFATGVVLLAVGPSGRDTWMLPHKAAFIVWVAATALHVLGHLPEMARGLLGERAEILTAAGMPASGRPLGGRVADAPRALAVRVAGGPGRAISLLAALAAGLALALALVPHFGPWVHSHHFGDH